ncbi:glycosyl transferase, family 4 [Flavobacteriaceae bacterium 3519-10]|nr:glycosyl transferase, family 4 [Flavobacteriaceae bacterium 3519-10]
MEYIIVTLLLFILMLAYFKIALKYKIIDKPNHRSAHSEVTIRGGGVVFPVAFLLFLLTIAGVGFLSLPASDINFENHNFLMFGIGLLLICIISFIDDVTDLSSKIRLAFHVVVVTFLMLFLDILAIQPMWLIPVLYIIIIGILNAYNFMDGINGITGLYTLAVLLSLWYINTYIIDFTADGFIIYPLLATIVFLFFNFRTKAKCFMGDIGSMGIAFWVIALLGLLILKTGELKWILFLSVYGVEVIATLLERLKLKENIFEAHRRHLYQLFANDLKISHLTVSAVYAVCQLLINAFVIFSDLPDAVIFPVVLMPLVILYFYTKYAVKKAIPKAAKK